MYDTCFFVKSVYTCAMMYVCMYVRCMVYGWMKDGWMMDGGVSAVCVGMVWGIFYDVRLRWARREHESQNNTDE